MNNPHRGYNCIIHMHGNRDFSLREESTSHIESIWLDIKRMLKGIYTAVRSENIVFLLKNVNSVKKFLVCLQEENYLNYKEYLIILNILLNIFYKNQILKIFQK